MNNVLVINWHLTELCNFKCRYCYAKWNSKKGELVKDYNNSKRLLDEVYNLFLYLKDIYNVSNLRINFAGGEPLLYKDKLLNLLLYAKNMGFETSLITNGFYLDEEFLYKISNYIDVLGVSIDSVMHESNVLIGRVNKNKGVDINRIKEMVKLLRSLNSNAKIKINTVVNKYNYDENFSDFIDGISPDRWKILKMLPIHNNDLFVFNKDFEYFVSRHHNFYKIMSIEDNESMISSYLMINPKGVIYQNDESMKGYCYSNGSILDIGAIEAFKQIRFDFEKYQRRYQIPIIIK